MLIRKGETVSDDKEPRLSFDTMSDDELRAEAERLREARSKATQVLRQRTKKTKATKPKSEKWGFGLE